MINVEWDTSDFIEVTNKDIQDVENQLGIKFPLDYIAVIKKFNGCSPIQDLVSRENFSEPFGYLLSIGKEDESIDLYKTYTNVKDRLIDNVFPFADDPGGNLYCFDYRSSDHPSICYWDHEEAFENREKAIKFICHTFTDLIESLTEDE
ncbi:SMI1/KNR4 family protein [Bacillus sp. FSL H8-0547]